MGIIGIKVWIFKGALFEKDIEKEKIERVKKCYNQQELNIEKRLKEE